MIELIYKTLIQLEKQGIKMQLIIQPAFLGLESETSLIRFYEDGRVLIQSIGIDPVCLGSEDATINKIVSLLTK